MVATWLSVRPTKARQAPKPSGFQPCPAIRQQIKLDLPSRLDTKLLQHFLPKGVSTAIENPGKHEAGSDHGMRELHMQRTPQLSR